MTEDITVRLRHKIYGTGDPGLTPLSDALMEIIRLRTALKLVSSMIDAGNYGAASTAARLSALEGKDD